MSRLSCGAVYFIFYFFIYLFFCAVLFIMLYKVVLTFESVDEIRKCDHSNESYWALLSCGAVSVLYKVVLTYETVH